MGANNCTQLPDAARKTHEKQRSPLLHCPDDGLDGDLRVFKVLSARGHTQDTQAFDALAATCGNAWQRKPTQANDVKYVRIKAAYSCEHAHRLGDQANKQ